MMGRLQAVIDPDTGCNGVAADRRCCIEQQPELEQEGTEGGVIVSIAGMQLQRSNPLAPS